jgi:hypothetical protein
MGETTFTGETDNTEQGDSFKCQGKGTYRIHGQRHVGQKFPAADVFIVVLTPYGNERPRI